MPVPWWQRIIDPEALVAGIVLAAVFGIVRLHRRWRVMFHRPPVRVGFHVVYVEPPWPLHVELGWIVIDVLKR